MEENSSYVDVGSLPGGFDEAHVSEQEREEAEEEEEKKEEEEEEEDDDDDEDSFVDECFQPANFSGNQEPSWASSGPALSSIEEPEEKMGAVGHWIQNNS